MGQVGFTDDELIECIQPVRAFACSLTKCPAAGDDLAQEVMLRCLRKRDFFQGGNLEAWTFTMCRRLFYNSRRHVSVKARHIDIADVFTDAIATPANQQDRVELNHLVACFRTLDRRDQVLIALVAIEGMAYVDVAEVLELPVGTVRSGLSRARKRLQARLDRGSNASSDECTYASLNPAEACIDRVVRDLAEA